MLEILGWIIVAWFSVSIIYSTQFHLRNYLNSKDSDFIIAEQMNGPTHVEPMTKRAFLKKMVGMQLYKATIVLILLYFLTK